MAKKISNALILLLSLFGGVIALWLTVGHYNHGMAPPCYAGPGGCEAVLTSSYSKVGPIPSAFLGFGMYVVLFILSLQRKKALASSAIMMSEANDFPRVSPEVRKYGKLIFGISLLGAAISMWLQYTALYVLVSFCPWCFTSACTVTIICLLATRDYLTDTGQLSGEQKMLIGVLSFIVVMFGLMLYPQTMAQFALTHQLSRKPEEIGEPGKMRAIVAPEGMDIKGDVKAPYTIVKFADYMCPACKDAVPIMDQLVERMPNIKVAFRNFPLEKHRWSHVAAMAAEAAARQGKFWEMHDAIYKNQSEMETEQFKKEDFLRIAKETGLDMDKFQKDWDDPAIKNRVNADIKDATTLQVNVTPTFFFVSDKRLWKFTSVKDLMSALQDKNHQMWH